MDNTKKLLESMVEILSHIKDVQDDVINLSKDSVVTISNFLSDNNIPLSEEVIKALQHQDIISQQLTATTEAIDAIDSNVKFYVHALREDSTILTKGFDKLNKKLISALEKAKSKKSAFSGNALGDNSESEIEFF
jgi:hypothetical protein